MNRHPDPWQWQVCFHVRIEGWKLVYSTASFLGKVNQVPAAVAWPCIRQAAADDKYRCACEEARSSKLQTALGVIWEFTVSICAELLSMVVGCWGALTKDCRATAAGRPRDREARRLST